jgi:predicted tellurium resistance membrane protein TerC
MNNSTVSKGVAATGVAGAIVLLICWIVLIVGHITVPGNVETAMTVIISWLGHMLAVKYGLPTDMARRIPPKGPDNTDDIRKELQT